MAVKDIFGFVASFFNERSRATTFRHLAKVAAFFGSITLFITNGDNLSVA